MSSAVNGGGGTTLLLAPKRERERRNRLVSIDQRFKERELITVCVGHRKANCYINVFRRVQPEWEDWSQRGGQRCGNEEGLPSNRYLSC